MDSLWDDREAARWPGELGQRVYASRLLGSDPALVLHGGGNTSVKLAEGGREVLYVKGSGADLAAVTERDFAPVDLAAARALLDEPDLDNDTMARRLRGCLLRADAPRPSIETLLHAALPSPCVDHSHCDAVLAVVNTVNGTRIAREVFGELAPLVPYRHSGVALARACAETFRTRGTLRNIGLVLQFHGAVAFGRDARESYENMLRLARLARDYLASRSAWELPRATVTGSVDPLAVAALRRDVSRAAGFPLVARTERDPVTLAFARRADLSAVSQVGPATPQHAVFGRRVPMLGRDATAFSAAYHAYLSRHLGDSWRAALDPSPRIALDPELGMVAFGVDARHAAVAAEIYRHDIEIISRAAAHDAYASASEAAIARAELEYGGVEPRLRREAEGGKPLLGQVAVVAPAAAARDPELAQRLLAQGAAVALAASGAAAQDALLALDPERAAEAPLRVATGFGGADLLFAAERDGAWRQGFAPLLALSPVASRVEAVA